jgi:hypothetical protein
MTEVDVTELHCRAICSVSCVRAVVNLRSTLGDERQRQRGRVVLPFERSTIDVLTAFLSGLPAITRVRIPFITEEV